MSTERVASMALDEFRRHLPLALRGRIWDWTDARTLTIEGGVTVTVDEIEPLVLSAVVRLPRLRITFSFAEGDGADFLAAWDRAFQRGGG